ncbi:FecCD family ABC transporter permease [Sporosarcina koreensis]|uniref:FecCD family ABC transporter permease n=1 Tax=Sporosarcina koreensis TaxID=334735 RepID=UPI00058D76FB|nr:iron ABC transporter permease [Sporosarcina koreensis]
MTGRNPTLILLAGPVLLAAGLLLSLRYGSADIALADLVHALVKYDPSVMEDQIVLSSRLPRALGSMLIGALLSVSGAVMQGVTRNYLAAPSILGVTEGSVLFVTVGMVFWSSSRTELFVLSFLGSIVSLLIVFGIARLVPHGFQPVRLAIIGLVSGTLFGSVATGLGIYFGKAQNLSFWYNARLDKFDFDQLKLGLPFIVTGFVLALLLSKSITILSLGEETAVGLGVRRQLIMTLSIVSVALMTGASVALAGSISFIGLVVPHITRFLVGHDYRWIIPCSAMLGAVFLCYADLLSRFVNHPYETPVSLVITILCIPFFMYLIHRKGGTQGV